ncbi:MAG: NUDIX hydrolase [Pseudonocardia sp.]
MTDYGPQPELTDGVVVLRPWRDEDIDTARLGHDEEVRRWFGSPEVIPSHETQAAAVARWRASYDDNRSTVNFLVVHEGHPAGWAEVRDKGDRVGELSWGLYAGFRGRGLATRAVGLLIDYAFGELKLERLEAQTDAENIRSIRVAQRNGMMREGLMRQWSTRDDARTDAVLLARLVDDPPFTTPEGFRAMLNSALPRKRAISQMLVRSADERVLLCQLTYKRDWDLPGGVVEVGESPVLAVSREVEEELGLTIKAGSLLLTDWLPPWGGWDDALCLVFDGGVHPASVADEIVVQPREIRSAKFCTLDEVRDLAADFTARRVEAALANLDQGPSYTESGR